MNGGNKEIWNQKSKDEKKKKKKERVIGNFRQSGHRPRKRRQKAKEIACRTRITKKKECEEKRTKRLRRCLNKKLK